MKKVERRACTTTVHDLGRRWVGGVRDSRRRILEHSAPRSSRRQPRKSALLRQCCVDQIILVGEWRQADSTFLFVLSPKRMSSCNSKPKENKISYDQKNHCTADTSAIFDFRQVVRCLVIYYSHSNWLQNVFTACSWADIQNELRRLIQHRKSTLYFSIQYLWILLLTYGDKTRIVFEIVSTQYNSLSPI